MAGAELCAGRALRAERAALAENAAPCKVGRKTARLV